MRVIQVYQTNPFFQGQGGGVRYVNNLTLCLKQKVEKILFLGIGGSEVRKDNIHFKPITSKLTGYFSFLVKLFFLLPFMNLKEYEIVHVHRLYFAIPFILLKPRLKIVCSLHGRTFSVFESRHGTGLLNLVQPIFKVIEKFCIKRIDYLVPVSLDVLNHFKNKYPSITTKSLSIIGSMFSFDGFTIQSSDYLQSKFGANNIYILFIGRLAAVKNVDFLIELWDKKFQTKRNIKLIVAGDGELGSNLKNLVSRRNMENKPQFLGEIPPENIPKLISSANICVLCSNHEASPTVVKEALACGVPLVSNNIGDVMDFIKNGENGIIVNKNIQDYEKAIIKLIDQPISKKDVRTYSEEVLGKSTIQYITKEYLNIYTAIKK